MVGIFYLFIGNRPPTTFLESICGAAVPANKKIGRGGLTAILAGINYSILDRMSAWEEKYRL